MPSPAPDSATRTRSWPRRLPRTLLWGALVALLLVAQSLLVWLTIRHEATRAQERVDDDAAAVAAELRRQTQRALQQLQALTQPELPVAIWTGAARTTLSTRREIAHLERRDADLRVLHSQDTPYRAALFAHLGRAETSLEADLACAAARRSMSPAFSRSYYLPTGQGLGTEVADLCLPVQAAGRLDGFVVATFALAVMLEESQQPEQLRLYEASFVEGDGTRLARTGAGRGAGVYQSERLVDLPGTSLQLRLDAVQAGPRLIPNLATALVLGLSAALFGLVLLLVRDVRRRARAERALAEALAFRKAMEDSLVTGLRARDLEGRVTYANPAFCAMVGMSIDEMRASDPPPYWPPERVEENRLRQAERLAAAQDAPRVGYESEFMRRSGERFPVMVYDAPLVDVQGRHAGWMSAIVDITEQRRVEDLSRQQQERLSATARLATVGEMASLLSHELNQPLAAIASYANGSLNLMAAEAAAGAGTHAAAPDDDTQAMLRQAVQRIAEQAERAGRVIKSVHDFVRRREQSREPLQVAALFDAVLPLVRLAARKSGARIDTELADPGLRVLADRTMIEQVLLNLARNGIQAMEDATPHPRRVLALRARRVHARWVELSVVDAGPGIAPEVAQRLFTPFYTTKREGMGLGLSLCRTVIEQHGGALDFEAAAGGGTVFRFTLPVP
jgi:two-component system sensor histidine kinase DctS